MARAHGLLHSSSHRAHRSAPRFRTILIGLLAIATAAAVGLLFLRGGGDAAAAGSFEAAHDRAVAAAQQVPVAAAEVQRELDLDKFNARIDELVKDMTAQRAALGRLARDNDGERRQIAERAERATLLLINATQEFRRAVAVTNRLVDARDAQVQLNLRVADLDAAAAEWEQT